MRWMTICALAALVIAPTGALAGTAEDPEVADPAGDAGVEGNALPLGGDDVDILAAWFATNGTGTWAHLELASFDAHPEDVVFTVDATLSEERWIGVGYGSYIVPYPPFRTQGFQGCTGTGDQRPNCTTLPGEMLEERSGFAVRIPPSWIASESGLREPTAQVAAYTLWPAVTFDEAGPGEPYLFDENATESASEDAGSGAGGEAAAIHDEGREVPGYGSALTATAASAAVLAGGRTGRWP